MPKTEKEMNEGMRGVLKKFFGTKEIKAGEAKPPQPKDLGSGYARGTAETIKNRKKQIDEALGE